MFAKTAESVQRQFDDEITKIWEADASLTLEQATREARYARPDLVKALNLLT
jgi:hypothetical protein